VMIGIGGIVRMSADRTLVAEGIGRWKMAGKIATKGSVGSRRGL
jgi:hypothetical protein